MRLASSDDIRMLKGTTPNRVWIRGKKKTNKQKCLTGIGTTEEKGRKVESLLNADFD